MLVVSLLAGLARRLVLARFLLLFFLSFPGFSVLFFLAPDASAAAELDLSLGRGVLDTLNLLGLMFMTMASSLVPRPTRTGSFFSTSVLGGALAFPLR